jgi:hypothetical protein
MRSKFNNMILKVMEAARLKKLKFFLQGKKDKRSIITFSKIIGDLDASEIYRDKKLNILDNISFKEWLSLEYNHLKVSWIQEKVLKEFGGVEIIKAYLNLLKVMEITRSKNKFTNLEYKEVKKSNFNNNQRLIYNPVKYYRLKIYAPIYEIKNKLKV